MSDSRAERLFAALREALSRRSPELDRARLRRAVLHGYALRRQQPGRAMAYRAAFAGIALAAALGIWLSLRGPSMTTFAVAGHGGAIGALLEATAAQPLPLVFSEGSRVSLGARSRGRVTRLTPHGARVDLERGFVSADVVHRPDTDWMFGAGPFEVAVLGTQLDVAWEPEPGRFEIKVSRGAVRVRGPLIQGGQEVRAGQVCRVDLSRKVMELGSQTAAGSEQQPAAPGAALAPPAAAEATVAGSSAAPTPSAPATGEPSKPSWVMLAQVGKPREAVAAAERAGLGTVYTGASSESLLELARAARLAGRADIERAALLACRKRAAGQAAAAQAAYLLGRASPPAEAVTWFEAYLHDQPHGLLAREASGRLIESYLAAGNRLGAERAAAQYLRAYPQGPHAAMARQLLASEERQK